MLGFFYLLSFVYIYLCTNAISSVSLRRGNNLPSRKRVLFLKMRSGLLYYRLRFELFISWRSQMADGSNTSVARRQKRRGRSEPGGIISIPYRMLPYINKFPAPGLNPNVDASYNKTTTDTQKDGVPEVVVRISKTPLEDPHPLIPIQGHMPVRH